MFILFVTVVYVPYIRWEGKGRYGLFRWRMNAGCAGRTVRSLENTSLSALEVWSRQGAIQSHVYLFRVVTMLIYWEVISEMTCSVLSGILNYAILTCLLCSMIPMCLSDFSIRADLCDSHWWWWWQWWDDAAYWRWFTTDASWWHQCCTGQQLSLLLLSCSNCMVLVVDVVWCRNTTFSAKMF